MWRGLFVFLAALALALPAFADQRSHPEIVRDIADTVNRYTQFTIFDDVEADVTGGRVVLSGAVTMAFKKDDIERRVREVGGVTAVENRIELLPVSAMDDELRYRIARAIYGNAAFWNYAALPNPPIHIVVKNGRVRLVGVVANDVERTLARSLATGFGALEVTNALRTGAELNAEPRTQN